MTLCWGMQSNIGFGLTELRRDALAQDGGLVLCRDRRTPLESSTEKPFYSL